MTQRAVSVLKPLGRARADLVVCALHCPGTNQRLTSPQQGHGLVHIHPLEVNMKSLVSYKERLSGEHPRKQGSSLVWLGGEGNLTNLYGHSLIQKPSSLAESRSRRDTDKSSGRG